MNLDPQLDGRERPGEGLLYRLLGDGPEFLLGSFRCPARHPRWGRLNETGVYPGFILPRIPVRIEMIGGQAGVIDPGCALWINPGDGYRRAPVVADGEHSEWIALTWDRVAALGPTLDLAELEGGNWPRRIPVRALDHALQRLLFRQVGMGGAPDALLLDEALCGLFASLHSARGRDRSHSRAPRGHRALVDDLLTLLAERYAEPGGLTELAGALSVSAAHLCRVFRSVTGESIHAHRERLRLAAALERFESGAPDLTGLALDLGYSSHAHFTANFARSLGVPPSRIRQAMSCGTAPQRDGRTLSAAMVSAAAGCCRSWEGS